MLVNLLISTFIQWLVFLAIPFMVYLIFFRKEYTFLNFIGVKKSDKISFKLFSIVSIISLVYLLINIIFITKYKVGINDIRYLSFQKTGLSLETILILLINSIVLTSFLEELIFRGFLINAFKEKIGFNFANQIQAIIFTAIHTLGTIQIGLSFFNIIIATFSVYVLSFYFGILTKKANYSIFYSAFFHGSINLISGILLMVLI